MKHKNRSNRKNNYLLLKNNQYNNLNNSNYNSIRSKLLKRLKILLLFKFNKKPLFLLLLPLFLIDINLKFLNMPLLKNLDNLSLNLLIKILLINKETNNKTLWKRNKILHKQQLFPSKYNNKILFIIMIIKGNWIKIFRKKELKKLTNIILWEDGKILKSMVPF